VLGFFINGNLLKRKANIKILFTAGIFLTVLPLSLLMFFVRTGGYSVIFHGLLVGAGNGIYWSCRSYLTYLVTTETNRDYFMGTQFFMIVICNALIPLLFGAIILGSNPDPDYKINAYKYSSLFVVFLSLIAGFFILKSRFKSPAITRFVYFRYGRVWNLQRVIAASVGMAQSGFMVLIVLLILNFAGDESVLGKIEFFAAILSAITTYLIGRISRPGLRGRIMLIGTLCLLTGGIALSLLINNMNMFLNLVTYSFLGVIIMKVSQVISDPMINTTYAATFQSSIEKSSFHQNRDSFSFIMDHELFLNTGRIAGGLLFLSLISFAGDTVALQYSFIFLAAIQLLSAYLVSKQNKTTSPGKRLVDMGK